MKSLVRRGIRRLGYELVPVQAAVPRAVRSDYQPILEMIGSYRFKFLDVKTFLPTTIKRAYLLGLHSSEPLRILDIATGVGYFPAVCKYYGHTAVAIDRDGNQVFEDATKWLNVDRRSWEISAYTPIPYLGQKFDLVTSFMVNFDRSPAPEFKPWGTSEWDFFLSDIARTHLDEHGRFVLLLNPHTLGVASVMKRFAAQGARVDGAWVLFDTLAAYREAPL